MDAKEIQDALQSKLDGLKEQFATPDQVKAIEDDFNQFKKGLEGKGNEELTAYKAEAEKTIEDMKADFDQKLNDQKEILKKQGEELSKNKRSVMRKNNPLHEFQTKFEEETKEEGGLSQKNTEVRFRFKVDNPQTFTIGDVADPSYPGGTTSNVSQTIREYEAGLATDRIYEAPKRVPSFLNGVQTLPVEDGMLRAVVKTTETGDAAVVGECLVKPYASVAFTIESTDCETIAVLWKESRKWRMNMRRLLPAVRRHMNELLGRKIEQVMFGNDANFQGFKNFASAYTPVAGLQFTAPDKLEAIGATIYSMTNAEFTPTTVIVNPVDYGTMVHHRAADGHYDQFNNGSIRIINGSQIVSGSNIINMTTSNLVAPGEFFVGDMNEAIIALGNEVEFSQGFVNDDFERNLITNRLELDAALNVPTVVRGAFVSDTYAAVIPQITI